MSTTNGKVEGNEEPLTQEAMMKMMAEMREEIKDLRKNNAPVTASSNKQGLDYNLIKDIIKNEMKGSNTPVVDEIDYTKVHFMENSIDPDDYDEVGTTFCAYSSMYVIVDDKRNGIAVRPPHGNLIVFDYQATQRTRVGKYDEIATFCAYTSHSKKETEWLKNHTYYGLLFFPNAKDALSVDAKNTQILSAKITLAMSMNQHEVVQACKRYNIGIGEDLKIMKVNLARKMAEEQINSDKTARREKNKESYETEMLSGKK